MKKTYLICQCCKHLVFKEEVHLFFSKNHCNICFEKAMDKRVKEFERDVHIRIIEDYPNFPSKIVFGGLLKRLKNKS